MWILRLKGYNNITLQVGLTAERCKFNNFCCSIPVSFNSDFNGYYTWKEMTFTNPEPQGTGITGHQLILVLISGTV